MSIKDTIISKNEGQAATKLALFDRRFPLNEDATELIVATNPDDYSAARIARAVEDCDAHLLNLNVTGTRTPEGNLIVDLRVNHRNGDHVARSLERYGYEVLEYNSADTLSLDTARDRVSEILRILDI